MDMDKREELLNGKHTEMIERVGKREMFLSFFITKKENLQKETLPLFQAVIFGSFDCMQALINLGANVLQQEKNGWNIVQYLVVVSYFSLDSEDKAVKIYKHLLMCLSLFQIRALLYMEDKEGFRSLELAAHAWCLCL